MASAHRIDARRVVQRPFRDEIVGVRWEDAGRMSNAVGGNEGPAIIILALAHRCEPGAGLQRLLYAFCLHLRALAVVNRLVDPVAASDAQRRSGQEQAGGPNCEGSLYHAHDQGIGLPPRAPASAACSKGLAPFWRPFDK